jgi:hypothetical protein
MEELNTKVFKKEIDNEIHTVTIQMSCFEGQEPYFSMTYDAYKAGRVRSDRNFISGGCAGQEYYDKNWPELAHLRKWHLCSTKGPMYYVANSLYHASNRDCWGFLKGEVKSYETTITFDNVPIKHKIDKKFLKWIFEQDKQTLCIVERPYTGTEYKFDPHYSFEGFGQNWYECPFKTKEEAQDFLNALLNCKVTLHETPCAWGEGKEPDLEAARSCAIWPDAQLEDFTKEKLEARLPKLMEQFRKELNEFGLLQGLE